MGRQQGRVAERGGARQKGIGLVAAAAFALGAALVPVAANAATFTVTNTGDAGAGSLRAAVAQANAAAGADTINFTVTGTITLTSGEISVIDSVTIDGPGAASLTISGNDASRVFNIDDYSSATNLDVTIEGLTITDGAATNQSGGAILSAENLTIIDSEITGSTAGSGGGILASAGNITLTNVGISSCHATADAGGLDILTATSATLNGVRITNDTAATFVGGIYIFGVGTLVIDDTTVSGNVAPAYGGMVISFCSDDAPAVIRRTTVSGNTASSGNWGGILIEETTATLENVTISGNSATDGAGIYLSSSLVAINHSTLTGNTASGDGGNIYSLDSTTTISNSIVANGAANASPDIAENGGTVTANYSLIEVAPGFLLGANNITGVDPILGALQNNGGPTQTHRPATGSPVVDAGDPSFVAPPSTDQRGSTRVINNRIDIGALEVQNALSLSSATYSAGENGGTLTVTVGRAGSTGALSIQYATSNGTASAGSDYTAASGTLNWIDGDTASKTFDVTITNDAVYEGNETFNITLSSPTGEVSVGTSAAVATITDNETQPTISIGNVTANEGNSGTTNFTFAVTLSGASASTIMASYATANGSALAGSDYTTAGGTVTFNPLVTSQNVVVAVTGETTVENDETFTVTLSSPSNATIANGTGTGTITNDDASPFGAPLLFSATAASTSQVDLSWGPVSGASSYEVFRATSITGNYSLAGATSNTVLSDNTVSANTTYLYKVRAIGAGTSGFSPVDAATTVSFTDPSLSGVRIKGTHITQLRTAVAAMRIAAELPAATFTDSTITAQSTQVKRVHITELRTALDAARAAIGLSVLGYTDPTITAQSTTVKSAHVTELRWGTQ